MLLGEYEHSLDPKGRVAVPARLRDELGPCFMITKGLDGCLFLYSMEQWKLLEAKVAGLPMTNKAARDFTRFLFGGACEAQCDKQGRVLLPANLRTFAGLSCNVMIIGVGTRAELWDREKWLQYNAEKDENYLNQLAEELDDLGI